jgi:lipopolysaccharide transport system ATP-binding protein
MLSEVVIRAEKLSKAYSIYRNPSDRLKQFLFGKWKSFCDNYWALQDFSVEIYRGETVGIIGRNGSGKSTFLQLVYGTLSPSSGTREIRGRVAALLELGAGFNPEFTGRENVFLAASILGLTTEDIESRLHTIIDFAGIGDFIDQPVKLYSSGMYARLAFAVAAHVDADVLIIDEILAVGDAAFTQKCMRFIRSFKEHGTIIFVSHDTAAVVNLCDRCVWLDAGKLRRVGPTREVCEEYLAALAGEAENGDAFKIGGVRKSPPATPPSDIRHETLKESPLSNHMEIFDFDPNAPWFGTKDATIKAVSLCNRDGERLPSLQGTEEVVLKVEVDAHRDLLRPIVGFYVKDRLGQRVFGDNTFITYRHAVNAVGSGSAFAASFRFTMPFLPSGDYSISCALAEGSQDEHIQLHWIEDALFFKVLSSHIVHGLIGVPMHDINITVNARSERAHVEGV